MRSGWSSGSDMGMCELNNHNAVCTFAMECVKKISDFIVEILEEFKKNF